VYYEWGSKFQYFLAVSTPCAAGGCDSLFEDKNPLSIIIFVSLAGILKFSFWSGKLGVNQRQECFKKMF
jgi:hypothetical protein